MSYGYVPAPLTPPSAAQKSWFSRNWKWFLPVTIGVPLLFALMIVGIISLAFGMMKSSEPYQHAVSAAGNDVKVRARLGVPVTPGWYASGSINLTNDSGNADLAIPLKGPQGDGTVYVTAKKSAGIWSYDHLEVEVNGVPDRINLLPPSEQEDK